MISAIRTAVLRKTRRCWVCRRRKRATQCHHHMYTRNNLLGVNYNGIKPICGICHKMVEFTKGEKITMVDARRKLTRIRKWKKWPKIVRSIEAERRRRRRSEKQGGRVPMPAVTERDLDRLLWRY